MKKYCLSILFYCIAAVPCFSQMCQTQGALIRAVSINAAGYPEITWAFSFTTDATRIGHLVYDYLGGAACSNLIGETDLLTNVYTHTAVPLPLTGPRSYTVAYKTATEPGPLTRQHAYSFLQAAYDSCTYAIALQWTPYEGWDGAVTYNVYGGTQGDPPVLWTTGHTATSYTLVNVPDNVSYDIYVVAVHPTDASITSASNRVTVETKTAQRPLSMSISSIEYIDDAVTLQFAIDPTTRLSTFHLTRSDRIDGGYIPIHTFSDKTLTTFTDAPVKSRYYYRLTAENYCRIEAVQGNPWQNIPMTMEAREGAWHLTWHADYLFSWLNIMVPPPYTLKRLQPQPATLLSQVFDTTYIDAVDLSNAELKYCYRVEGVLGLAVSATEVCQTYRPQMIMPDAIAPNSVVQNPATGRQRNQFGPIVYANPTTYRYRLEIYTRNGDLIAAIEKKEADLPTDKSWTGMNRNGSPVQEGVYLYNVQLIYTTGQTETHTGAVTVVYE
ncbi:MAG: gliding motility-associated C-terminal domain-containing protein [Prevotellaceae bacterium]|nr:gliding motility-associated C-terminal domain-containing protein [Prevotellaceae bacterium]